MSYVGVGAVMCMALLTGVDVVEDMLLINRYRGVWNWSSF